MSEEDTARVGGIGTDDVRIGPLAETDLDELERFATDPAAFGEFEWSGFMDPRRRRRRWETDGLIGGDSALLAVRLPDGTLAGTVEHRVVDTGGPRGGCVEIGIALFPEHRGRGLGRAAQRLLTDYVFATTFANRVQATTEAGNIAERRTLAAIGFREEGTFRGAAFRGGQWRDLVMYARLRGDA